MNKTDFRGVLPALTTKMTPDQEVDLAGVTSPVTRAPRLPLASTEAAHVRAVTEEGLRTRPDLAKYGF